MAFNSIYCQMFFNEFYESINPLSQHHRL